MLVGVSCGSEVLMNATLTLPRGEEPDFHSGEVYFIGNATTLIRFAGFAILTDPAFLHKGTMSISGTVSMLGARWSQIAR